MTPSISIVIPHYNQASRLALTLAGLERQCGIEPDEIEVLVVDNSSGDRVRQLVARTAAQSSFPMIFLSCNAPGRRGHVRNLGASHASGEILLFLDADGCPGDDLLAGHLCAQAREACVVLGDLHSIEGTQRLADPADPRTVLSGDGPAPVKISAADVSRHGEQALKPLATKAYYPGLGRWQREVEALVQEGALFDWVGAIPHNMSVPRRSFFDVGGFDPFLRHLEGWDFGIRAKRAGVRMAFAPGARTYHLLHPRDAAGDAANSRRAETLLARRHPDASVIPAILWGAAHSFSDPRLPSEVPLSDWRWVATQAGNAQGRRFLERIYRAWRAVDEPRELIDYLAGAALNSPLPTSK